MTIPTEDLCRYKIYILLGIPFISGIVARYTILHEGLLCNDTLALYAPTTTSIVSNSLIHLTI